MFIRLAVDELSVQCSRGVITCEIGWWARGSGSAPKFPSFHSASILLSGGPTFKVENGFLVYRDKLIPVEEVIYGDDETVVFAKKREKLDGSDQS